MHVHCCTCTACDKRFHMDDVHVHEYEPPNTSFDLTTNSARGKLNLKYWAISQMYPTDWFVCKAGHITRRKVLQLESVSSNK